MSEPLYVATDAHGVEHAAQGEIAWELPGDVGANTRGGARPGVLRPAAALLEVLDERIYRAESSGEVTIRPDGAVDSTAARLISRTQWDAGSATEFALDCAAHALVHADGTTLPDGTPLTDVLANAREMLRTTDANSAERLGYLARLSAYRRLRREVADVASSGAQHLADALSRDLEALESPDYAATVAVVDALLCAVEAVRHQVLPHALVETGEDREAREEHRAIDDTDEAKLPTITETPFGSVMAGGGRRRAAFEPSWIGAREAARHCRMAAFDRGGEAGQAAETAWQAAALSEILAR